MNQSLKPLRPLRVLCASAVNRHPRCTLLPIIAAAFLFFTACNVGEIEQAGEDEAAVTETKKTGPVVYVALGDSTGVGVGARKGGGYVARLFERIERERPGSRLVNLCVSGATTSDVLRAQVGRVAASRPTLVTIGIGINDVTHGQTPEQFARNFDEIIRRIKEQTDAPIVVTNIPDISFAPRVPPFMRDGVRAQIGLFNAELSRIAASHNLKMVDAYAFSHEVIPRHPEFFSPDGFHPSEEGYEFWAVKMWPVVKEALQ